MNGGSVAGMGTVVEIKLFVCLFSFLCFFLVTIFPCYDEQWLVVNGGRVAGLGARSKPRGECHRFMAEQLPAPPAPPHYPKLSSRLQLLILYSASFKSTLGTSSWPLTIFPLGSQKEKRSNFPRTLHWQYPNALMTRFQLILLVWSQTPPNFKVVIEWG